MSDKKIEGTPEEMNRKTAERITSSHYGVEQTAATFKLENDIFSALQVVQKRGEVWTSFRQDVAVEQIRYICEQHIHADRSISLEAQGFSEIECAEIVAEESLAKKILETIQLQKRTGTTGNVDNE